MDIVVDKEVSDFHPAYKHPFLPDVHCGSEGIVRMFFLLCVGRKIEYNDIDPVAAAGLKVMLDCLVGDNLVPER